MIRNQRGAVDLNYCSEMSIGWQRAALKLTVILRLAVLLNRSRSTQDLPSINLLVSDNKVDLSTPGNWLQNNPLSVADLAREAGYLSEVDFDLKFR